jgi:hypothetical protein
MSAAAVSSPCCPSTHTVLPLLLSSTVAFVGHEGILNVHFSSSLINGKISTSVFNDKIYFRGNVVKEYE